MSLCGTALRCGTLKTSLLDKVLLCCSTSRPGSNNKYLAQKSIWLTCAYRPSLQLNRCYKQPYPPPPFFFYISVCLLLNSPFSSMPHFIVQTNSDYLAKQAQVTADIQSKWPLKLTSDIIAWHTQPLGTWQLELPNKGMTEAFWTGSEFLRDTFPCKFVQEITFKHVNLQEGLARAGM